MKNLNEKHMSDICECFDQMIWLTAQSVWSSEWRKIVKQLRFSEITTLQNVNIISHDYDPGLPVLSYLEGLDIINRVAPNLESLVIQPHEDGESAYIQLGPHCFEIRNFHLSHLFEIIHGKCVNLEVVSIDTPTLPPKLMTKIIKKNPKLRALNLVGNTISAIFPKGTRIPTLEEIYLHGTYESIKGFSALSRNLAVIDLTNCRIGTKDLPDLLLEILYHKHSLECLRMNIFVRDSKDEEHCSAFKNALIMCCPSLMVFKITCRSYINVINEM